MNITPQQARAAFFQAAANIEARPELYDFDITVVGDDNRPACMWGHVGRALKLPSSWHTYDHYGDRGVANHLGMTDRSLYDFTYRLSMRIPRDVAARLRAFADHHYPAESTHPFRPDLAECGMTFGHLMESISERVL